jgi:hypothetical protein
MEGLLKNQRILLGRPTPGVLRKAIRIKRLCWSHALSGKRKNLVEDLCLPRGTKVNLFNLCVHLSLKNSSIAHADFPTDIRVAHYNDKDLYKPNELPVVTDQHNEIIPLDQWEDKLIGSVVCATVEPI